MLGKLLKYEISATGRLFLPFYGALLIFALINKLFFAVDISLPDFVSDVTMGIYVIIIIAIIVLTYIVMIQRFYKNLLTDEGYLMFTLPVKPWQLVASKLITAILWVIVSLVVTLFTIFLLAFNGEVILHMHEIWYEIQNELSFNIGSLLPFSLSLAVTSFIGGVSAILMIYTSIAIGHLFNKHRALASFGAFLGLNFVIQIFSTLFVKQMIYPIINRLEKFDGSFTELTGLLNGVFSLSNILNLFFIVVFFFVTCYILQKKLNLE